MASSLPHDLTGIVSKTGTYSFAIGGHSDIWMGEWLRGGSRQIVAVKVIRDVWSNADHIERLKTKFLLEAKLWSRLEHPNITPFYGICFDLGPPSAPCLIYPYFKNGNVAKYLEKNSNVNRVKLVSQVVAGLEYLHNHNIIHGDIKASNVLVNDEHEVRIADFGLSRILGEPGFTTKSVGGTYRWMAPELLAPGEESVPQVTMASDVWAFGMTVIEILTGRLPFVQFKYHLAVIHFVAGGGRPTQERYPEIDDNVWSVLERCWHTDPTRRPSMEALALSLG